MVQRVVATPIVIHYSCLEVSGNNAYIVMSLDHCAINRQVLHCGAVEPAKQSGSTISIGRIIFM